MMHGQKNIKKFSIL